MPEPSGSLLTGHAVGPAAIEPHQVTGESAHRPRGIVCSKARILIKKKSDNVNGFLRFWIWNFQGVNCSNRCTNRIATGHRTASIGFIRSVVIPIERETGSICRPCDDVVNNSVLKHIERQCVGGRTETEIQCRCFRGNWQSRSPQASEWIRGSPRVRRYDCYRASRCDCRTLQSINRVLTDFVCHRTIQLAECGRFSDHCNVCTDDEGVRDRIRAVRNRSCYTRLNDVTGLNSCIVRVSIAVNVGEGGTTIVVDNKGDIWSRPSMSATEGGRCGW